MRRRIDAVGRGQQQAVLRRDLRRNRLRPYAIAARRAIRIARATSIASPASTHPASAPVVARLEIVAARQHREPRARGRRGEVDHDVGQPSARVARDDDVLGRHHDRARDRASPRIAPGRRGAATRLDQRGVQRRARTAVRDGIDRRSPTGDESSRISITCASSPWPPPRSTTRPPRKQTAGAARDFPGFVELLARQAARRHRRRGRSDRRAIHRRSDRGPSRSGARESREKMPP